VWKTAFMEFNKTGTIEQFTELFVNWTQKIFSEKYLINSSMHKAFRSFVDDNNEWAKRWLLEKYVIEILDKNFNPTEPRWANLSP